MKIKTAKRDKSLHPTMQPPEKQYDRERETETEEKANFVIASGHRNLYIKNLNFTSKNSVQSPH